MTRRILVTAAVLLAIVVAAPVSAQWQIKVSDETNVKFGVLLQGWADWQQDAATGSYSENLFLRRARILMGGQIIKDVSFFLETDNPNLGKANAAGAKGLGSGLIMQDAFVDWKLTKGKELGVQGGLLLIPFCRNCLNSAASLMTLDYGAYSFLQSAATGSVTGRDTGFQARGYLLGERLEYRAAVTQGFRETGSRNAYRTSGRVQYAFFDKESVAMFYPGTYFGKKKMLIVGGGIDAQATYYAYAADYFLDLPVGAGGVTSEGNFIHYDGERTFATLKRQNDTNFQIGLWIKDVKLFPYLRWEHQSFSDPGLDVNDQDRYQIGLGYFLSGHNATLKAAFTRVDPQTGPRSNQFTIQLQGFYF